MSEKTREELLNEIDELASRTDNLYNEFHDAALEVFRGHIDTHMMLLNEAFAKSLTQISIDIDSMQTSVINRDKQETYINFNEKIDLNGRETIPRYTIETSLKADSKGEITGTYIDIVSAENRNEILLRMKNDDPELFELVNDAFKSKTNIDLVSALKREDMLLANNQEIEEAINNLDKLAVIYESYSETLELLESKMNEVDKISMSSPEIEEKKNGAVSIIVEAGLKKGAECLEELSEEQDNIAKNNENNKPKEKIGFFEKVKKNISVPNPLSIAKKVGQSIGRFVEKAEKISPSISAEPVIDFVKDIGARIHGSAAYDIAQTAVKAVRLPRNEMQKIQLDEQIDDLTERINNCDARLKITDERIETSKTAVIAVKAVIAEAIDKTLPDLKLKAEHINASEQTVRDLTKQVEHTKTALTDNINKLSGVIDRTSETAVLKIVDSLDSLASAFLNKDSIPDVRALVNSARNVKESIIKPIETYKETATIAVIENLESSKNNIESNKNELTEKRSTLMEKAAVLSGAIKAIRRDGFSGIISLPRPKEKAETPKHTKSSYEFALGM